ncbi:hypothetical protein BGAL_0049g00380 [Botrytis galanthina]|uniref:Uncharacterized protein n=1 Tax=Botrytis galanthina TaxID=278940 RepID=A0A4S8R6F1_9HELO|nr:hypothetical protein BGAL_0049g00380 [Botrytis galanthina]
MYDSAEEDIEPRQPSTYTTELLAARNVEQATNCNGDLAFCSHAMDVRHARIEPPTTSAFVISSDVISEVRTEFQT